MTFQLRRLCDEILKRITRPSGTANLCQIARLLAEQQLELENVREQVSPAGGVASFNHVKDIEREVGKVNQRAGDQAARLARLEEKISTFEARPVTVMHPEGECYQQVFQDELDRLARAFGVDPMVAVDRVIEMFDHQRSELSELTRTIERMQEEGERHLEVDLVTGDVFVEEGVSRRKVGRIVSKPLSWQRQMMLAIKLGGV